MILYFPSDEEAFFNLGKIYIQLKLYKEGLDYINLTKKSLDNIKHELEIIDE